MSVSKRPVASPATSSPNSHDAMRAIHDALAAKLRERNKANLFDALRAAGIHQVVVSFDGYGDSGQIENLEAKAGDEIVALPSDAVDIGIVAWGQAEGEMRSMSLCEAVEQLCYDCLEETQSGWENSDGAYGDFLFDVAERTITLDYNERYLVSEHSSHRF